MLFCYTSNPHRRELVKRHRGEPGHTRTCKKTPGGAGTHTGHTGHADAQRHTDHTDEPHNHPNTCTGKLGCVQLSLQASKIVLGVTCGSSKLHTQPGERARAAQRHNPVPAKAVGGRDARTHAPGSEHRRARHHRLCRIEYLPKTRCMQSVTLIPLALNQDAHQAVSRFPCVLET